VPSYDMRCRACGETFEVKRCMAQADDPASCPNGHEDTVRLFSAVAFAGGGHGQGPATGGSGRPGGCCQGGCCSR